jgi:hypothetical protein
MHRSSHVYCTFRSQNPNKQGLMGTLLYALGPLSPTYYIVRRAIISLQRQLNSSEAHKVAPLHVESTNKTSKKPLKSKWPCTRSFAIQRKKLNSPKYKKPHLVTLFSVSLRVFPFSDQPPKSSNSRKSFQTLCS